MSDLNNEASLFLFGRSYHDHWKHPVGTAIGIMNGKLMKNDTKVSVVRVFFLSLILFYSGTWLSS